MSESPSPNSPTNRTALISLVAGVLTVLSLCTAIAPIPLTGYVCYPSAAVLGVVALITGIASLIQMRASQEYGRTYALIGIWIGGLAIVASACAVTAGVLLVPKMVAFLQQYLR